MKKLVGNSGYLAYEVDRVELTLLRSPGMCDTCSQRPFRGYLVPVLNQFLCCECYKEFESFIKYYESDIPIERKNAAYYEKMIPMEVQDV
ncbi:MAG: hypothetical protein PHS57_05985 [Alphaproteobacteria bacterium]|nr:hypothetical protein [Alphaproteobacteria bacterium]